jgi:hypothetical protein
MSLKNPATPPGIDPGTFRLLAQPLNNYATPGPSKEGTILLFKKECLLVRKTINFDTIPPPKKK